MKTREYSAPAAPQTSGHGEIPLRKVVRLTADKKAVKVRHGGRAPVAFQVSNEGSVADRYQASITGIPNAWYDLGATGGPDDGVFGLTILPDTGERVQLIVCPPAGAATGTYTITIRMTSKYDSNVSASTTVTLMVKPRPTWAVVVPPLVLVPALFVLAQNYVPTPATRQRGLAKSTALQPDATGVLIATAPPALGVMLNPITVPFGKRQIHVTSARHRIYLVNVGTTPLHITKLVISGVNQGDFTERDTCTRAVIVAADGCAITVSFSPTGGGARSASLHIIGTTSPL